MLDGIFGQQLMIGHYYPSGKLNEKLTLIERQLEFLEAQASSANEGFIGEREECE